MTLAALTSQLRRSPKQPALLTKRGIVRYKKHDFKGAIGDLDRAIELDDSNAEAHYHRGLARQKVGNLRGAASDFNWIREHSEDPYFKTAVGNRLR